MNTFIPENILPQHLLAPKADAAGRTSSVYLDIGKAAKAWLVVYLDQGNAATVQLDPVQATAAAGTGSKALTNSVQIWSNLDMAASNAFVKRTSAKTYTTDAGVKVKCVVFEIDPGALDLNNSFRYIGVTTGASNAANITSAMLYTLPRFGGKTAV